jgi:hypothetical protein
MRLEDESMPLLSLECVSKRSFDDHIDASIREITSEREIEVVRDNTSGIGGEAGISKIITVRGRRESSERYRSQSTGTGAAPTF